MPKQLHAFCQRVAADMKRLVEKLEKQERAAVPPAHDSVEALIRIRDDIQSTLSTQSYVARNYTGGESQFNKLLSTVRSMGGAENTPDYGYFGPAPNFAQNPGLGGLAPTADGVASMAGFAADAGLAMVAVLKQHLAIVKEKRTYEKDPAGLKRDLMVAYCALVGLLRVMIVRCAAGEGEARKYHSHGLNYAIASTAWSKAKMYDWCAAVG